LVHSPKAGKLPTKSEKEDTMGSFALQIRNGEISIKNRGEGLAGLYEATECKMVEVAAVGTFGGVKVALLCDEEGLLVDSPERNLTAADLRAEMSNGSPEYSLVGTCSLVVDDTNLRGFTADELANIKKQLRHGGYPMAAESTFTMAGIEVHVIHG